MNEADEINTPPEPSSTNASWWVYVLAVFGFLGYVFVAVWDFSPEGIGMFFGGLVIPLVIGTFAYYGIVKKMNIFKADLGKMSTIQTLKDPRMYAIWFVVAFLWQIVVILGTTN